MNQSSEEPTCLVAIKIKLLWWKGKVGSFKADAVRRLHWIISDMTVHYYILQAHIWMTISLCQLYSFRTLADPSLASASSVFRVRHWSVSHSWEGKKKGQSSECGSILSQNWWNFSWIGCWGCTSMERAWWHFRSFVIKVDTGLQRAVVC